MLVMERIRKTTKHGLCERCGTNDWSIMNDPVLIPTLQIRYLPMPPTASIEAAMLVCARCANIRFYALYVLGLRVTSEGVVSL